MSFNVSTYSFTNSASSADQIAITFPQDVDIACIWAWQKAPGDMTAASVQVEVHLPPSRLGYELRGPTTLTGAKVDFIEAFALNCNNAKESSVTFPGPDHLHISRGETLTLTGPSTINGGYNVRVSIMYKPTQK